MKPHLRVIKVRGYHCDFYGHLNHARYLELFEEARWSYLEGRMDPGEWAQRDRGIVVARLTIDYKRPAPVDTVLEISTQPAELGARTGVIHQEMVNRDNGKQIAVADVTFAVVDTRTGRAVALDDELRAVLAPDGIGDRG